MGKKKRTPAPNPTPPPPDAPRRPPAAGVGGGGGADAAVRAEVDKALACLQRGSHARALRLMKDAVARHGEGASPLLLRAHGTVHARAASVLDDPAARARHQRAALQAAQRAVELAPDSVELAHFHAMLLFDAATDARGYEEVVSECERGLSIEAPSDPAPHSLRLPGPDVDQVQSELRNLIQKANLASISTWVKTLGGAGDDKLRLIPVRRLAEEPMEGRLVPTLPSPRRPNEIKKATKTPEERRQEIEVRLAAMRLLQQQKEQSNGAVAATPTSSQSQGDDAPSSSSQSSVGGHRADRRRGGSRKVTVSSTSDRMDQVRAYWAAIPVEQRLAFLNTSISELKSYYAAMMHKEKDAASVASDVLNEVLGFAAKSGKWEFWVCGRCREQFADAESHRLHVLREHVGILSPELQDMVPHEIDAGWARMLIGWNWRPLDATAALKLFEEEQADNLGLDRDKDSMSSDSWSNKDKSDTSESSVSPHNEESDGFAVVMREGYRKWPLSDDVERANILERIHSLFQILVKNKNLSVSNLNKVIQFAMEELRGMLSESLLLNHSLDESPHCICFLEASSLRKVVKFLQDLMQSSGLNRHLEKDEGLGDGDTFPKNHDGLEKVTLNSDSSELIIDGESFGRKFVSENVDTDALLSWLYAGSSIGEQLLGWNRMLEERSNQGVDLLRALEREFNSLQNLCERKLEQLRNEEALISVESIFAQEQADRDEMGHYQGYEELLRKRQEELLDFNAEVMTNRSRSELDVVSSILKEVHTSHFGYDEAFSSMAPRLCDYDGTEEEGWRLPDLQSNDSVVHVVVSKMKEQITMELSKIDAKIMRNVAVMHQLEHKLGPASSLDYRTVLIPLMKSFLQTHLEELVDKDARERSDAAREAFLAELALDAKKNASNHEKSKEKKKLKDSRRSKDPKDSSWSDQYLVCQDSADEETREKFQLVADCDDLDCKLSTSDDYFNEQEEELRHRVQLEAEERKLEETLEYQRRIEEETKQKHLAEQFRSTYASSVVGTAGLSSTGKGNLEGIKFGDFRYSDVPLQEHSSYTENSFRGEHNGWDSPGEQALTSSDMRVSRLTLKMNGIWTNAQHIKPQGNPSIQKPKKSTSEGQKKYVQGVPGAVYDDDRACGPQFGTAAPRWSSRSKIAPYANHNYHDGKQNQLHVLPSDDRLFVNKGHAAGTEKSNFEKVGSDGIPSEDVCIEDDFDKRFQEDLNEAVRADTLLSPRMTAKVALLTLMVSLLAAAPPAKSERRGFRATLIRRGRAINFTRAVQQSHERLSMLTARLDAAAGRVTTQSPLRWDGAGAYDMEFSIGTPPQKLTVLADTGSDLIWTKCGACASCTPQGSPSYYPDKSSSFSKSPCSDRLCGVLKSESTVTCGAGDAECDYRYSYGLSIDGHHYTQGYLGTETFTLGGAAAQGVGFGCTTMSEGNYGTGSGLVGLGRGNVSLVSQLDVGAFSYCLTRDASKPSPLLFGSMADLAGAGVQTTPLLPSKVFYAVNLKSISVGATTTPGTGSSDGIVFDSGTTLTYLAEPAYTAARTALMSQTALPPASGTSGFDTCFQIPSNSSSVEVPTMVMHFDGADMNLPAENYFTVVARGVLCWIVQRSPSRTSLLGNIMQTKYHIRHDVEKSVLSFQPADCDSL